MRFALIDNKLVEASPGLKGLCPGCAQAVIAKCGTLRIHQWAHRNNKVCDDWWEPETLWHRSWKSNFPREWQEIFLPDEQTGEKHVADVRTSHGLVIEFQHSHIDAKERASRAFSLVIFPIGALTASNVYAIERVSVGTNLKFPNLA